MIFQATPLAGVFVVVPEPKEDERGFFARTWCPRELAEHGLETQLAQVSISFNSKSGTVRGMHYQIAPSAEVKLVRCTQGAIYDVAIDLRRNSPTFQRWTAVDLTAENRRGLYVPKGCAHGFQVRADNTEVLYMISEFQDPATARGVRWNDPAFGIEWPLSVSCISERDRTYAEFDPARFEE
jgi:dTDP-4-dehydrorhamnose 3,5-epimerase